MKMRLSSFVCIALLLLPGCGSSPRHHQPTSASAVAANEAAPTDGAMAVFRAKVTPILCTYALGLKSAEQQITQASYDAGGAINASAPASAQAEYAHAMRNFSDALHTALDGFRSVAAPSTLTDAYRGFIASLTNVSGYADRAAAYAAAGNYAGIAAMENISTPTAGEGVFHAAGITGCQAPTA